MKCRAWGMLACAALVAGCRPPDTPEHLRISGGDPSRGRAVVESTGCGVCHVIPGINGPNGRLGPSLDRFGTRPLIAGVAPNRPDVLTQFVRNAPSIAADTAMPDLPLKDEEARDVAAFLYTLR